MTWSDVTKSPSSTTLRQFAGLCLVVFGGFAGWRVWQAGLDGRAITFGAIGLGIGLTGLVWPVAVRWVYTGWMIAAFPIGWVISRVVLGILFYGMFTPVAFVFRLMQRDMLHRRRTGAQSYWTRKPGAMDVREYFRQF